MLLLTNKNKTGKNSCDINGLKINSYYVFDIPTVLCTSITVTLYFAKEFSCYFVIIYPVSSSIIRPQRSGQLPTTSIYDPLIIIIMNSSISVYITIFVKDM